MRLEERIWKEYSQDLLRFLVARTRDPDLAEELVQETLIKAYEARDRLQDLSKLKSWLFAIARNTLVDTYRGNARFEPFNPELHDMEVTDEILEDQTIGDCLARLARRLPPAYRDAVIMSDLDGRKQQWIADRLGLSLSGAKSRVQRGRAKLKELLFSCCPLTFDEAGVPNRCSRCH